MKRRPAGHHSATVMPLLNAKRSGIGDIGDGEKTEVNRW